MVNEFFAEGGRDVAVKLTPGVSGIFQVFVDGEKIYDKAEEGGKYPDLPRVKQLRAIVKDRLQTAVAADDN
jgi:predicted Rdx family selenoprotein